MRPSSADLARIPGRTNSNLAKRTPWAEFRKLLFLIVPLVFAACGNSTVGDAGLLDSGPTLTLTINDYMSWCGITENGAAFSATKTFTAGSVVNLHAAPLSGFVWGYWTGTDADTGSHDTNMTASVTMSGNKTVLACCPFPPPQSQTCP